MTGGRGALEAGPDLAALEDRVRYELFRWSAPGAPDRVGVEVEWIPVDARTGDRLPIRDEEGRGTLDVLLAHGCPRGWRVGVSGSGSPRLDLPGGAFLTFEPGGQLELSSPTTATVDALVDDVLGVAEPLREAALDHGVRLVARGYDPTNPLAGARLHLDGDRYRRMSDHYDRRGPWGRAMMRQSAGIHVNLDFGTDPGRRWRVANRAVPFLLAAFANSPRAEGRDTGHRSWRAAQWRRLDPSRTGIDGQDGDPVRRYLDFALGAEAFLMGPEGRPSVPYRTLLDRATGEDWERHLTTLFPEVRPRGYLELRVFDALPPRWYGVPLAVSAGLLYDRRALADADDLLDPPSPEVLERAGREGVRDPALRDGAVQLLRVGLEGAKRLGGAGRSAELVEDFLECLTAHGRDPGDEPEQ